MNGRVHWSSVREDPCCPSEGPQVGSSLGHHAFCSSLSMFLSAEMMVRSPGRPRAPTVCQVQYCGFCPHIKCCSAPSASSGLSSFGSVRLQTPGIGRQSDGSFCIPPPIPFLGPVGKNPVLSVFFFSFSSSPLSPLLLFLPLPLLLPFSTSEH